MNFSLKTERDMKEFISSLTLSELNRLPMKSGSYMSMLVICLEKVIQEQFTGKVIVRGDRQVNWKFNFFCGNLVWIEGGYLPYRSWLRMLSYYYPEIDNNLKSSCYQNRDCKNQLQKDRVEQLKFQSLIINRATEMLFDILQYSTNRKISIKIEPKSNNYLFASDSTPNLQSFNPRFLWAKCQGAYDFLRAAGAQKIPLNSAPKIANNEEFKKIVSNKSFFQLTHYLNGSFSIRDLELKWSIDSAKICVTLLPHINSKFIKLLELKDFSPLDLDDFSQNSKVADYQNLLNRAQF
jgi:two-component system, chemotaxis family, response regulator PixG